MTKTPVEESRITVAELIELLKKFPQDWNVVIQGDEIGTLSRPYPKEYHVRDDRWNPDRVHDAKFHGEKVVIL